MVFPVDPGQYIPLFFVPGLNGVVYPEFYSTVTTRLASYGYLIAGVDLYWPALIGGSAHPSKENLRSDRNPELSFKVLEWVGDVAFVV